MGEPRRASYLGVPQYFTLNIACAPIVRAFGWHVYLVGSCLTRRDFRDVDVRCILDDDDFARLFPRGLRAYDDPRLAFLNVAVSEWLATRTRLPIDFQFQAQSEANEKFPHRRNALGVFVAEQPEDSRHG